MWLTVFTVSEHKDRLRVVSNLGDRDCEAGEIHTRARAKFQNFWRSPRVASPRNFARACVCIAPAPQSRSPKLEITRSLT